MCVMFFYRSWAPDRTAAQAKKYIEETMGKKFAEGVILDMEAMWEESNLRIPMICFLSMGSDPTQSIEFLSKKRELGETTSIHKCVSCALQH